MIRQVTFEPAHLRALILQPQQQEARLLIGNPALGISLDRGGVAFTGVDRFGRAIICAGAVPVWPGRAVGWAVLSLIPPRDWPQLHKLVLRGLDGLQRDPAYRRLEVSAVADFSPAHRWILMLGFEVETVLARQYDPSGQDHVLYARIR